MTNDYSMILGFVFLVIAAFCFFAVIVTAGSDHWILGWLCWSPCIFVLYFLIRFPKAFRENLDRNPIYVLVGLPLSAWLSYWCYSQAWAK